MSIRSVGKRLFLQSGQSMEFDLPVAEALEVGGVVIVVLDGSPSFKTGENVYGVDARGRLLWQIERREFPHGSCSYTGVTQTPSGTVVSNYSGFYVRIDPETGRILSQGFSK